MDSRVARYALEAGTLSTVDPSAPYAELWIGTHPSGPSSCSDDGASLEEAVGQQLPFLFKILSAGKALSIQAHPDKATAERLHSDDPSHYPDDNHKPELAVALTPFEAMCGFRRMEEVVALLKRHPEFAACVSDEAKLAVFMCHDEASTKEALRSLFASFMACDPATSDRQLRTLIRRLQLEQAGTHPHPHDEPPWERKCARAVLRLAQQFPGDPGAMAPLFLNYLLIAPGESFFMAANEPHAYVAGEIIECMACSDNVVRCGLTPKFKDVGNLVGLLTYTMGGPSIDVGVCCGDPRLIRYTPPVPEFEVVIGTCDPGEELSLPVLKIPSIFLVIEGTGTSIGGGMAGSLVLRPGRCFMVPARVSTPLTLCVAKEQKGPLRIAVAHENLHLQDPTSVPRRGSVSEDEYIKRTASIEEEDEDFGDPYA